MDKININLLNCRCRSKATCRKNIAGKKDTKEYGYIST